MNRAMEVAMCGRLVQSLVLLAGIATMPPWRTAQASTVVRGNNAYSCSLSDPSDYVPVHYNDVEWNSANDPPLAEYVQLTPPTNHTYFACVRLGRLPLRESESIFHLQSWLQWKKTYVEVIRKSSDDVGVGLSIMTDILIDSSSGASSSTHTFRYSGQNASFRFQDGFNKSCSCVPHYGYLPQMSYTDALKKQVFTTCTICQGCGTGSTCPKWKAVACNNQAFTGSLRLIETSKIYITLPIPLHSPNRSGNITVTSAHTNLPAGASGNVSALKANFPMVVLLLLIYVTYVLK